MHRAVIEIHAPGRTENCQIGVFAAYASARGRALADRELYPPRPWTDAPERCRAARIPDQRSFATKPELARGLVLRALSSALPIAWVTADAAYGQEWRFRRMLEEVRVGYVLAVPKSQQVPSFGRIDHVLAGAPDEAWERFSCGAGSKGPRVYDWAAARLPAVAEFDGDDPAHHPWVLARRSLARADEVASYLAYAPADTTVAELGRVAGARWAIEECFQAARNECGLDQYEVRRYVGWYRHITLAMTAITSPCGDGRPLRTRTSSGRWWPSTSPAWCCSASGSTTWAGWPVTRRAPWTA
ncbi:IS701 family transposase [Streptomyces sp. NPDC004520]|uniref:IS701 family transposase n=1 Tax=Streptomyces sp. NPDC004520 TaxID=3364702 RepID=UPI00367D03CF